MKTLLFGIGLFIFFSTCTEKKKAIFVADKSTVMLDTILTGQQKSAAVTIKNEGDKPLIIEQHISSCECTVMNLKDSVVIKPSDSLTVSFAVKGYVEDTGKWKHVLCTFKANTDSVFSRINISYFTKQANAPNAKSE